MLRASIFVSISAALYLLLAPIVSAQGSHLQDLQSPLTRRGPVFPGDPRWPGTPVQQQGPKIPSVPGIESIPKFRRLKPTWVLEYLANRWPVPSAPTDRMICRMDEVREVVASSNPVEVGMTQVSPQFPDMDAARIWVSRETAFFAQAVNHMYTIRLQYLQLHQMRCATPTVTSRLKILRAYVTADKPAFRAEGVLLKGGRSADTAQGAEGYSWFQPFTVLTDGVSLQEKRLRLVTEGSCDASSEVIEAIRAKRYEQTSCVGMRAPAALDSPSGLASYAQCEAIVAPRFDGCIWEDGAGSGCEGDPERIHMPYLMAPKNALSQIPTVKLGAIDATLAGVSTLLPVIEAAESRFSASDHAAQEKIAASISHLQTAISQESALLDTERARLILERRDLEMIGAQITHQKQEVAQQTRDKARAQEAVSASQAMLQKAQAQYTLTQRDASAALQRAETAFIDDEGKRGYCPAMSLDCSSEIEADFNRSSASVDAFKSAQLVVQDSNAARLKVVKLLNAVMKERLNLMKTSILLSETQTLLDANNDQYAKRTQRLNKDQQHLNVHVADSDQDRLKFNAAVNSISTLTAAPSQSCSRP